MQCREAIVDHALNAACAIRRPLRVSQAGSAVQATSSEHFDVEVARLFFRLGARCETLTRFEVRCQSCASTSSTNHTVCRIVENVDYAHKPEARKMYAMLPSSFSDPFSQSHPCSRFFVREGNVITDVAKVTVLSVHEL